MSRSLLDPGQIIQTAFDDSSGRIKVSTDATVIGGQQEVLISESDDSIKVYGSDGSTNRAIKTDSAGSVSINDGSNSITVDGTVTTASSVVSSANSSTSTLTNGSTYTGTWVDVTGYNTVVASVKTDQAGTLYMEFSPDGSNADSSQTFTISAATNETHRLNVSYRYYRTRFLNNSGSGQSYFRLQTILGNHFLINSPLNNSITNDSDATITRSIIYGQQNNGNYAEVPVTPEGHLEVALHAPRLPFGSVHAESIYPIFQCDAVYGLNTGQINTYVSGSGSATASDSAFVISSGTTVGSQATIQSRKRLRYRPGQGIVGRFTALFTSPVSSSYQIAGFGHAEDGIYVGYKNTSFGILYTNRGVRETRTLTIGTASSTTESVTLTLNGTAYSVPVTNSGNTQKTAYEIATYASYAGWDAEQIGSTVVFISGSAGSLTGTYSVTGSTIVGTFARTKAGVAATENFIAQSSWNGDKLDGTGPSGVTIDPTKFNTFQVKIQYLGAGVITVESEVVDVNGSNNADWVTLHTIQIPNSLTQTSFGNPSFPFTMAVYSAGSTTDLTVKSGSFAGFIEGERRLQGNRFTYYNSNSSVAATNYQVLFTIRNDRVFGGRTNQSIINILSVSGAADHTKPTVLYLIRNATLAGTPNFAQYSTLSATTYDTAATTCTFSTNNQLIWTGSLAINGSINFSFEDDITIQPGETLTLAAKTLSGSATTVNASINTREDQ